MIDKHSTREEVLAAVTQKGWVLRLASDGLQDDQVVVRAAVEQDGRVFEFASERLQKHASLSGGALQYASERLRTVYFKLQETIEKRLKEFEDEA